MHSLEIILYSICFVALVSGVIFSILALKYKTNISPSFPVWNPKRWASWKEWFTERGIQYSRISGILLAFGGILYLLTDFILFPH